MSDATILVGDCLDELRRLEPRSVDLVLGSPPYEDKRGYSELAYGLRGDAWVGWCADRYVECLRVCRGLVAWVVGHGSNGCSQWSAAPALLIAELHRRGVCLRNPAIYRRISVPGSGGKDWLRADYEWIVCATNGGRLPWSDNTAFGTAPKYARGGALSHRLRAGERVAKGRSPLPSRTNPGNVVQATYTAEQVAGFLASRDAGDVIDCKVGGGLMGSPLAHENEAPFPETLADFFVCSFCPPGGIVLDPFSGSGTTAKVALARGRKAIAVEIRSDQADLTRRRIAEAEGIEALGRSRADGK